MKHNTNDIARLLKEGEDRGFPGMLGSLDWFGLLAADPAAGTVSGLAFSSVCSRVAVAFLCHYCSLLLSHSKVWSWITTPLFAFGWHWFFGSWQLLFCFSFVSYGLLRFLWRWFSGSWFLTAAISRFCSAAAELLGLDVD
ncbi:hypothetical protein Q3G72_022281 [Acer saccharum]|nr:hypothetical protein Q3G72_022281 [Acer saccharum]